MRTSTLVLLALLGACTRAPRPASARPDGISDGGPGSGDEEATRAVRTHGPMAPVVVTLVVDQLAAWVLSERLPILRPEGGFARLVREGTYVREARYAHAATDTAPGHAAIYTGAPPHDSGVFANERLDESLAKVSVALDRATLLVDADGPRAGAIGSSAAILRVQTVADELRKAHPDAVVISLSLKDRGAIFGGGRSPTDVVWYDPGTGRFVSSTAFTKALPPWLAGAAELAPALGASWDAPLRPEWVRAHAPTADAQEGEGDYLGLGATFPHALPRTSVPAKAFRATPFADHALLAMALRAIDDRHAGEQPTLIAVSLSANDYIGHVFGPDSWEAYDELNRLDGELAAFLAALDARFGASGYAVLLTADHGTVPMPDTAQRPRARPWCERDGADRWRRPCIAGTRIIGRKLTDSLEELLSKTFGPGRWIAGVADPYVAFTEKAHDLQPAKRAKLVASVTAALLGNAGVARVIETSSLPADCPPEADESVDALICRSHAQGAPGDLYVLTKPGSFFDPELAEDRGTSHGTPYLFDRTVPILARAPGRVEAGRVVEAPMTYRTFAKTASVLLGVPAPSGAAGAPSLTRD